MRRRSCHFACLAVAAVAAGAVAGCGALPPQAPPPMAKTVNSSTGAISTACGEAYQVTAFGGDHARELAALSSIAASSAVQLASVDKRNPNWIFQGQTLSEIVHNSISYLRSCGLPRSAAVLARRTTEH